MNTRAADEWVGRFRRSEPGTRGWILSFFPCFPNVGHPYLPTLSSRVLPDALPRLNGAIDGDVRSVGAPAGACVQDIRFRKNCIPRDYANCSRLAPSAPHLCTPRSCHAVAPDTSKTSARFDAATLSSLQRWWRTSSLGELIRVFKRVDVNETQHSLTAAWQVAETAQGQRGKH